MLPNPMNPIFISVHLALENKSTTPHTYGSRAGGTRPTCVADMGIAKHPSEGRVDQAQRIHLADQLSTSCAVGLGDPALRALIHLIIPAGKRRLLEVKRYFKLIVVFTPLGLLDSSNQREMTVLVWV